LGLATLRHTIMIGDSSSDVEAGRRVGARTVLLDPRSASTQRLEATAPAPHIRNGSVRFAPADPTASGQHGLAVAPTLLHAVRRELCS
jgi:FMN phosphatase YigB (HAD superfamily)